MRETPRTVFGLHQRQHRCKGKAADPHRLGALESTAASRLPDILGRFHGAYPDVRVELQTGTNDALTTAVRERRLDAAFVVETPADPVLASMPLFAERLVLISAIGHKAVRGPRDVRGESVIAFPSGCAYRRVLERCKRCVEPVLWGVDVRAPA